jgi:SAM-dependent methyltransferase
VKISYETYHTFPGWELARATVSSLIERERLRSILEIGAGANPTLPTSYVQARKLAYTTNDVSATELAKADPAYDTLCHDMSAPLPRDIATRRFDFVFSRMVNEHVADGRRYYENVYSLLMPGGLTLHCYSTLYALPFLINRVLPERLSDRLLDSFNPRDRDQHAKFRAHYSWSRGPTRRMIERFDSIGFDVLEYRGYFGHGYYTRRLPVLQRVEDVKARWLCRHPVASLTSYSMVLLRRRVASA